jgi:hypothetical protein
LFVGTGVVVMHDTGWRCRNKTTLKRRFEARMYAISTLNITLENVKGFLPTCSSPGAVPES